MVAEDSKDCLISVVVPTRHRNDLLALCLQCLAPGVQTLEAKNYEVIVTDDGRDSTAEALIRSRFPWVRWVQGPVKGPAANRNYGARQALGRWVVFTDDDCLPSPQWLESFQRAAAGGDAVFEGKTICSEGLTSVLQHAPLNETGGALWSCNMMVLRTFFERLQGFDESFPWPHLEDVDFRERIFALGEKPVFVPDALVDHPPRPAHFGKRSAVMQEAEFLFYYKAGHDKPYLLHHIKRLVSARIDLLRRFPISRESITVLSSLAVEVSYVARHGRQWERKYRDRYRGSPASYASDIASRLAHMQ
jgi:GT2 family glycosyltransferase